MREYRVPATTAVDGDENLTDMVWANAERFGTAVSFRRPIDGTWIDVTAEEFAAQVLGVAKGLVAAGLAPGDRVALLSGTRYEWTLIDYAIWAAGCVTVPIDDTAAVDRIGSILADSGARAVVLETADHGSRVETAIRTASGTGGETAVEHRWRIDAPAGAGGAIAELIALGAAVADLDVPVRRRAVRADDLATVVYPAGGTGHPRGCELTHRNLLAQIRAEVTAFPRLLHSGNSILMVLPLTPVFARAITCAAVATRTTVGHTPDTRHLLRDLGSFRPTFLPVAPSVLEQVYAAVRQRAHAEGRDRMFDGAEETAVAYSAARERGGPGLALTLRHQAADRLVFRRLRMALGGRCVAAVSGGAPLGGRQAHFFRGIGVPVFEGYVATETTGAACVNVEGATRIGSVGRPVDGTAIRIAADGEVLVAGDVVFRGYWQDEAATAAALAGGWLHTGDIGSLDDDGFLTITRRREQRPAVDTSLLDD